MCGIAGAINFEGSACSPETLVNMAGALARRGPDDETLYHDEFLSLAFRRLSIIDVDAGKQPIWNENEDVLISVNGEIYNFKSLRHELESLNKPANFKGHSDTEVMLEAISNWGLESSLKRFNGMFAFALWDKKEKLLHLARDRMGEKPLYYGISPSGHFLFGSELKSLRKHPDFKFEIDRNSLALFLRHGYIPSPHSIYKEIFKLPPATFLTINIKNNKKLPEPTPYWSCHQAAENGSKAPLDETEKDIITQLDSLLTDAVGLRMESDVPLGAFLSGGIDSSTIVALMQSQSMKRVKTFSIGFHEKGYNEAEFAKAVAQHLGTEHTELYVTTKEAMNVIPNLSTLYDEPFADPSQIPTYLVSKMARRHVTVSLSGDGGDELFSGYSRYQRAEKWWSSLNRTPGTVRKSAAFLLKRLSPEAWNDLFRYLSSVLPSRVIKKLTGSKIHDLIDILEINHPDILYNWMLSYWKHPDDVVLHGEEYPTLMSEPTSTIKSQNFTERMMYADSMMYMPDDILTKTDRASMAVSLECRIPLLDHRVVEFAWKTPASMRVRNNQGKWPLRQVLYNYVPRELIERPKMGFGVPIGSWLKGDLKEWAEALLDEKKLHEEGFFNVSVVRKKWHEHITGKRDWQFHLWAILMFQQWYESTK